MIVKTKDYGFKAYLVLNYEVSKVNNTYDVNTNKDITTLIKEYNTSEFSTYNEILKTILKEG